MQPGYVYDMGMTHTQSETAPEATIARVTVNLPAKVWKALEAAAELDGITRTEALRRAISVDIFIREAVKGGSRILVESCSGKTEVIVFPY